jgi:hypothetical protein
MLSGWDRIFITTPRLFSGNPATLAWIPRSRAGITYETHKSPLLQVKIVLTVYMGNLND